MYQYALAIHIIFVVCWMAGLFYIVRLFIYHTEAQQKPEPARTILSEQFEVMEKKLWYIIAVPSMVLVLAAGITMLIIRPFWLQMGWMHIKLMFVVLLIAYHHICQSKMKQMRNGVFADFLGNHLSPMDLVFPIPHHTRLLLALHAHVLVSPIPRSLKYTRLGHS
ncbi:MAG: hypothetical protein EOO38_09000 [Cytophagaceae bacterium]|nr:MAG: hypothetical protein EOO38_09000 [Cytophagaceae bacterium]